MHNKPEHVQTNAGKSSPPRKLRSTLLSSAAILALGFASLGALAAAPANATPGSDYEVTICHATSAVNNPYGPKPITVDVASILNEPGHSGHTGPVFAAGMTSGWGDIIPPIGNNGDQYAGMNWTAEGQAIYNNGCRIPGTTDISLAAPAVVQAVCTDSVLSAPSVTPVAIEGVTYQTSGDVANRGTATVTAAATEPFTALTAGNGWVLKEDGTATFTVTFETVECNSTPPTPVDILLTAPAVAQALCTDGVPSTPSVTPVAIDGVEYQTTGNVANRGTAIVTATVTTDNTQLVAADGWNLNEDGTATFTVAFDKVACPAVVVTTPPATTTTPAAPATSDPAATTSAVQPTGLAETGANSGFFLALGALLLGLGGVAVWRTRRTAGKH
ncbi:LPXTG cell wall anchor domain-containing protein [Arthrobacter sp. A2-55]|uniref:LPXTG cell wall anchor domain-containing protein n=1 Tax=Arthrobacter sp. A2-55 TaxID=2897337 RepID=UPI0021CDCF83|nr:LPXTG cell wall anchor domain-containing protein [Arthrobacter sp. A2-55]MCU6481392.1 LPXTG cell wall anchor domain-containing protein [Arthrobacter sp. A2-55]